MTTALHAHLLKIVLSPQNSAIEWTLHLESIFLHDALEQDWLCQGCTALDSFTTGSLEIAGTLEGNAC